MIDGPDSPPAPDEDRSSDLEALLCRAFVFAERAVRRENLPADLKNDIGQEAMRRVWEEWRLRERPPTEERVRRLVDRIAASEKQRRRREARRLRAGASDAAQQGGGVPKLCPGLASLEMYSRRGRLYRHALRAAAAVVARERMTLSDSQFRLFHLAYEVQSDCDSIARAVKAPSRRALAKRLRRISRRVQERLLERFAEHMPEEVWATIYAIVVKRRSPAATGDSHTREEMTTLCEFVLKALREVVGEGLAPDVS